MPQDKPQFSSYPRIKVKRPRNSSKFFISGFFGKICEKQISEMYIKSIIDQILGIKEIIDSPNRVWSRGISVPDECAVYHQTYTKFMTILPRGE